MSSIGSKAQIIPQWPVPPHVKCLVTTRHGGGRHGGGSKGEGKKGDGKEGGASQGAYANNNLAMHVGDTKSRVERNREYLRTQTAQPHWAWLEQTHSTDLVQASHFRSQISSQQSLCADGSITAQEALVCVVLTADCLPVLLCDSKGRQVAAVHAGWRGLSAGIIDKAIARFDFPANELLAYLGPAISAAHFEVGADVLSAFEGYAYARNIALPEQSFRRHPHKAEHYFADLYALGRWQLNTLGVPAVFGGEFCTYAQQDLFYSYRRDGVTGRMATAIWIDHSDNTRSA